MIEPPSKPKPLRTPVRLRLYDESAVTTTDHGRRWATPKPLAVLAVEFSEDFWNADKQRSWYGALVRLDKGVDEVADALELLAAKIRSGVPCAINDAIRSGTDVNQEGVADLLS